ncbi:MAG: GNAT family N-acetyltransferase [Anaerolineales bacterium]
MNYTIRFATLDDASQIVRLIKELASLTHGKSTLDEHGVKEFLQTSHHHIVVAQSTSGSVVGLASFIYHKNLYHNGLVCSIEEIVVNWGHQNRGVGSALMEKVLEEARRCGCVAISLATEKDNDAAQRFYHRHGFNEEALFMEQHFIKG